MKVEAQVEHPLRQIPSGIWVLGFGSLLMDISSEMIHSLLPMFMVTVLGTSTLAVGIVDGLAESLALIVKVFSGTLSDYWGKRKGWPYSATPWGPSLSRSLRSPSVWTSS